MSMSQALLNELIELLQISSVELQADLIEFLKSCSCLGALQTDKDSAMVAVHFVSGYVPSERFACEFAASGARHFEREVLV